MKTFIKHLQINPATVALVFANLLMLVTLVAISRNLDQREKVALMVEQSAKDVQLVKEINYLYLQQITELSLLHSFAQSPVEQQIEPLHRDILAKLNALKQFNAEDAESMQIYDRLELLFIDLFNRTNEMLEIKRSKGIPAATKFIKNSNIYDLHNQISNELSRIKKNEDIDLTNDQQNFFLKRHETRRNLTFSVAAEIVLLVLCFVVLRQKFKIQQAAENLEKARVQILETLIQESSLEMTLIKIAQIVEAQNPDILVSILLLKDNQLFTAAAPSLPDFYKEAINGLEIGMGVGSCGTAAFTGNRTIVENLQTHPYWQKFRSVTKRANLNSCWSEPIFNYAGNVLGTFAIYHRYPCKPKNDGILLIEQVSRLIGIAIEKKQILDALQQSEERFQATIDILPIPVLLHDEVGKIKFLNPVFTQTFGYQLEDIPNLALWQTKTELENDSEEADFSKHNANEFIIRCLDGSKKTLLQTSSKIPPFCLQTFFDITERKKVEQLLADTNVQLMTLVEAIPDAILFKDSAGRWLIINESTKKLLALENIDWKNKTDFELAQLQPEFKATYLNCHENDKAVWENKSSVLFAEQMLSKTGGFLNLEVRKVPIFAEDGERQALLVIIRDVTERTLFEEELRHSKLEAEQANQAKSNFLANMSHEIRTPLNAVINFSYLASQTPLQPKQKDYIDKITLSGKNLLAIINDILDISKIEAGKLEIENAPFDLFSIIAQISAIIESRIADKQNPLKLHCNIDVPQYLIGDALRLNQVLLNLLTNAVKFTESGEITLTAKVLSQTPNQVYLQFSVQDSGIGMSQETMGNLFQPFTQADSSTSRRYGGTGLGLNICKRLVEMMGGKISVTSTANKGSCFTFTIPLTVCQSSDIPLIEKENASSLANFKVLLVDDEKNEREITAELLQKFGVNVELAGSGEEAIELLKQNNVYDGIFLDWKMAKMDGVETAQRIISEIDAAYKDKIIIITAYDNKLLRSQLQKLSIHRFVSKPVDVSNLFNAVISLANNKNASITANSQTHQALQEVSHLQPTRILLVEDNEINQEIVKELLIDYDLMIDIAENGIQAVEKVKNNTYQLVFMDLQMPEMDGFQATQIIRTELGKTDLPIVAMTAHAMKSEVDKCFAAGMNDHLSKPINPEEVYACLLKWLTVENVAKPVLTNVKPEKFDGLKTILNAEKGLFHVNQNQTLYQQLLTNFFNEQSLLLDNLPEDKDALTRKVHTLKSLSASLGMEELSQCAAQVEQSLMESVEIEQTLLSQLSEKLQNVLAVLKVWLDENALPVETVEKSEFDKQQAIELLEGISKNLKQDLGLATKMVGQLKPMLCENADFKTDFTSLEKSLGKFDIKNALKMTEQLISQLQSDVTQ